jgi:hypothetical protein
MSKECSIASSLNAEQRAALKKVVGQARQQDFGFIGDASARIKMLWFVYLSILDAEAEHSVNPRKRAVKGATASERRKALRQLKRELGRSPTVED